MVLAASGQACNYYYYYCNNYKIIQLFLEDDSTDKSAAGVWKLGIAAFCEAASNVSLDDKEAMRGTSGFVDLERLTALQSASLLFQAACSCLKSGTGL